jgi:hypothetical protein
MKCPKCSANNKFLTNYFLCTRRDPVTCAECNTRYYIRRYLSGFVVHFLFGSGLAFLLVILSFLFWGVTGFILSIVGTILLWVTLAYLEGKYFETIELTPEDEATGKRNLFIVRIIVFSVVTLLILWALVF